MKLEMEMTIINTSNERIEQIFDKSKYLHVIGIGEGPTLVNCIPNKHHKINYERVKSIEHRIEETAKNHQGNLMFFLSNKEYFSTEDATLISMYEAGQKINPKQLQINEKITNNLKNNGYKPSNVNDMIFSYMVFQSLGETFHK